MSFSDRIGVTQPRTNQLDDMDAPLRNSLWNFFLQRCLRATSFAGTGGGIWDQVMVFLIIRFFKEPLDRTPHPQYDRAVAWLVERYQRLQWFGVYNLIEFVVRELPLQPWFPPRNDVLALEVNAILTEELSAYRFIEGFLTPISSPSEIEAIQSAVASAGRSGLGGVQTHIRSALEKLGQKPQPDFRTP